MNPDANGLENEFDLQVINNDSVVFDAATGLMWQRSGSMNYMSLTDAVSFVDELNSSKFASYDDWRLPTLEEAMSLMESTLKNDFFLDPMFDKQQHIIWTSTRAWVVLFDYGYCGDFYLVNFHLYVRAVRS